MARCKFEGIFFIFFSRHFRSCEPVLGVFFCRTMENLREIIDVLNALKSQSGAFAVVLWGAWLLKKYVINGTINRYFDDKRRVRRILREISRKIDALNQEARSANTNTKEVLKDDVSALSIREADEPV